MRRTVGAQALVQRLRRDRRLDAVIAAVLLVALILLLILLRRPTPQSNVQGITTPTAAQVELATLNEINLDGWNATNNHLYINWLVGDPSQQNLSDSGPMSCAQTCSDAMVDIRDLVNMETYEAQNPGDTSQLSAINRLYPVVRAAMPGAAGMHPWVYDLFLELYSDSGDTAWLDDAKSYVSSYLAKWDARYSTVANTFYNTTSCRSGVLYSYRPDHNLQMGADFVDAQKRFGLNSAADGIAMARQTVTDGFNTGFGAFARVVCVNSDNSRYVGDSQVKVGEMGDSLLGVEDMYQATGDTSWLDIVRTELDSLAGGRLAQLHDSTNLGYGYEIIMPGGALTPCTTDTGCVKLDYREVRQYLLMPIVARANAWMNGRYDAMASELNTSVLLAWHAGTHPGYPYREKPSYDWYVAGGTTESWITTEAMGIAVHGLLTTVQGPPAAPTPTAPPSPSPAPSPTPSASPSPSSPPALSPSPTARPTPTAIPSASASPTATTSPCPGVQNVFTANVAARKSRSFFVDATSSVLCATATWSGGAHVDLVVYNSGGTTVLAQNTSGVSGESVRLQVKAGTTYKIKLSNTSGRSVSFRLIVTV